MITLKISHMINKSYGEYYNKLSFNHPQSVKRIDTGIWCLTSFHYITSLVALLLADYDGDGYLSIVGFSTIL